MQPKEERLSTCGHGEGCRGGTHWETLEQEEKRHREGQI